MTTTPKAANMTLFYINARSVRNKYIYLNDHITSNQYDIAAITETWVGMSDTDDTCINGLVPDGYSILRADRSDGRHGGGVAVLYKQNIHIKLTKCATYTTFECLSCLLTIHNTTTLIHVIYRPPPSKSNGLTTNSFLTEWAEFLSQATVAPSDMLIIGDLNIHLDNKTHPHTIEMNHVFDTNGLIQHIDKPTHYKNHILDVLISRVDSTLVKSFDVRDIGICDNDGQPKKDHYGIECELHCQRPTCMKKLVHYRKLRQIDVHQFCADILSSTTLTDMSGDANDLANRYVTGLQYLLDQHAPVQHRLIMPRPQSPWYSETSRTEKQYRRKLERKWRLTKKDAHRTEWRDQCSTVALALVNDKTEHYSSKIIESKGNQKELFKITKHLLKNQHQQQLPSHSSDDETADSFLKFFTTKIEDIRRSLKPQYITEKHLTDIEFDVLQPASTTEIHSIIMSYNNKSCDLDPIPTWLLKLCIRELLPIVTALINSSLSSGTFPQIFKNAIVKPHLKKVNLDPEMLKHYRPVSNLQFISKVLEKLVTLRLENHLNNPNMRDPLQSAYCTSHSTETAIVRITNDIISSLDKGKCTVLASLDLSAAFDTVDHTIFIHRLRHLYNIQGKALDWFTSYLSRRTHSVRINDVSSPTGAVLSGVPQGSVLGAMMYIMYTRPLCDIMKRHNVQYHCYADDTQVYTHCDNTASEIQNSIANLEECITEITHWMTQNALKINNEKTEFVVFSTQLDSARNTQLKVGSDIINCNTHVKILGVTLDIQMNMEKAIANTCRTAYMHIRKINSIRRYLSKDATSVLMQSNVLSGFDYCNSIYMGLPQKSVHKLQLVQNAAARVITNTPRHHHISPILRQLNWLPIVERCQLKILILTFKALHNVAPQYICELLNWYKPTRNLRSINTTSLVPNRNKTVRYGKRLIDTSAAQLWNTLPQNIKCTLNIKTFKYLVKQYLY